jgi:hypothetical protein
VKKVGFICEGETEVYLLGSEMVKDFLYEMNIESVGEFDAGGRSKLINEDEDLAKKFQILSDKEAEKIFVISDLEDDPCISYYKEKLYNYSSIAINIVAVKAIEAWLLCDSRTLSVLLRGRYDYDLPENTDALPLNKLQEIFLEKTGRGLGIGYKKPRIMKRFLRYGFTLYEAAKHPNCPSIKYFIKKLKEFSKE